MVDILLAAFNGEKYIAQQIDSILNQTYEDWKLYISDDCSCDNTVNIVKKYLEKYPDKIVLIQSTNSSGSSKNHFFKMLKYSVSEYIMFCDQDDIWLSDKIQLTIEKMIECEKQYRINTPLLVHTDLKVVDENLKIISNSLFKYQSLSYERSKLNNLLGQNIVTGCTMMINRELLDLTRNNIPKDAIMHDWWLALVASAFGQVIFLQSSTVLYRQHCNNEVGAKDVTSPFYILKRIKKHETKKSIELTYMQARSFSNIYNQNLSKEKKQIVSAYLEMYKLNKLNKIKYLYKYCFFKNSFMRKIGQIVYI